MEAFEETTEIQRHGFKDNENVSGPNPILADIRNID